MFSLFYVAVQVNGQDVSDINHFDAVTCLRRAPPLVTIRVQRGVTNEISPHSNMVDHQRTGCHVDSTVRNKQSKDVGYVFTIYPVVSYQSVKFETYLTNICYIYSETPTKLTLINPALSRNKPIIDFCHKWKTVNQFLFLSFYYIKTSPEVRISINKWENLKFPQIGHLT